MSEVIGELFELSGFSKEKGNERAMKIFGKLDFDGNGELDEREFVAGCMDDQELLKMLKGEDDAENPNGDEVFEFDYHVTKLDIEETID